MAELSAGGGMASVAASRAQLEGLLERWPGQLWIAALNSPSTTVVAGDDLAIDELLAECALDGVYASRIRVDYASHCPRMEALRDEMLAASGRGAAPAGLRCRCTPPRTWTGSATPR